METQGRDSSATRFWQPGVLAVAAVLVFATGLPGQTFSGSIIGSVQDPEGAAVPAAKVKLVQAATGVERELQTTEQGDFVFTHVPPAEYAILITANGFKQLERRKLVLTASETLSTGVSKLEVGALSETVTVTAQGATVQTASSERGGVITASQLDGIQVRGRNAWDLLQLLPGVVPASATSDSISRGPRLDINGGRINTISVVLDGMGMNQIGNFANELLNVSMDAVSEVKVLLTNYQAEYGRTSGAQLEMVTKSGTRDFHGMFSYFKRHEQFNANDYFSNRTGLAKGRYRYNTYAYNIGGPIYIPRRFNSDRNRLFFFWSQEFWPATTTNTGNLTVPTQLERAGDFSQSFDLNGALIPIKDPTSRTVFPGNVIPASRLDSSGLALLKLFPQANFSSRQISAGNYNYVFNAETSKPQRFGTLKLDYNLSPKHQLSSTVSVYLDKQEGWKVATTSANWNQLPRTYWTDPKLVALRYTFLASPTLVNELMFGANGRKEAEDIDPSLLAANQREKVGFTAGQLGPYVNPLGLIPNATFGGVPNAANLFLDTRTPLVSTRLNVPFSDTLTKTFRSHLIKVGVMAERIFATGNSANPFNGTFDFSRDVNNPLDTNYAYANAALGVFSSYTEQLSRFTMTEWNTYVEWFAQDTWKVNRRLALDVGLRFSVLGDTVVRGDMISTFNPSFYDSTKMVRLIQPAIVAGTKVGINPANGTVYPAVAIGAIAPNTGDAANGMVVPGLTNGYPRSGIENAGVLVAPRIGFAWDPFGDGKTAIRGGGGVFYQRKDVAWGGPSKQVPLVTTPVVYYGSFSNLLSSTGFSFPSAVSAVDRYAKAPSTINLSFSVQRNIGFGTVVDVAYVGTLGRHLAWLRDLNAIPLGANFNPANADPSNPKVALAASFLRPKLGYNSINMAEWAGNSTYHSLQATANRRFAHGVQFGAAWTWSKAMDYVDSDNSAIASVVSPRVWNYGLAGFDHTHLFTLNYLWDIPRTPWSRGLPNHVLNGWQISGITSFVSGTPLGIGYSLVTSQDITGSASQGARVVVLQDPVLPKSERTFSRNFRTDAFAAPAVGTIGNSAKTVIRGPGVNNWDITFIKRIAVRDPLQVEFRAELYNAFNHTQFSGLDTTARFNQQGAQVNANFGAFTSAYSPRLIQLVLRLRF